MQTLPQRRRRLYQNPAAVRRRRVAMGLRQVDLAEQAGIVVSHVSNIENGKSSASVDVLSRLAAVFDCKVEELMAEELGP